MQYARTAAMAALSAVLATGVAVAGLAGQALAASITPPPTASIGGATWVQVSTPGQLEYIDQHQTAPISATSAATYLTAHIELMAGITLSPSPTPGSSNWAPWGESTSFSGTFNGQGYAITGVVINDTTDTYVGFFGQTSGTATVENLGIGALVSGGGGYNGGLVGWQGGGTITASDATGAVSGGLNSYNGGLVGWQNGGSITASDATGTVSGNTATNGGLVGEQDAGSITASNATGAVSGSGGSSSSATNGGLVGVSAGTIRASNATGAVSGADAFNGGLVGRDVVTPSITASYATGAVTGKNGINGGLVGWQGGGTITASYATGAVSGAYGDNGGLAGYQGGTITASYATGAVSDGGYNGGLVGYQASGGSIIASYFDTTLTGQPETAGVGSSPSATGVTGATTSAMQTESTYPATWDFTNTWGLSTQNPTINGGFPYLRALAASYLPMTLNATSTMAVYGQSVTFTASVNTPAGGTITFYDGSTKLATDVVSAAAASAAGNTSAAVNIRTLPIGTDAITATYQSPSEDFAVSSPGLTETISPAETTVTLTASPNPAVVGQSVKLTATVAAQAPGGGIRTSGTVTFYDGSQLLGSSTLSNGAATLTTALPGGAYSLTAQYGGNGDYVGSTSNPVSETIQQAATAVVLKATPNPAVVGQAVTLTATVAAQAPGGGTPGGAVAFYDGTQSLGTGPVGTNGTATLTTTQLPVGTDILTAQYGGSPSYVKSASTSINETINPAATSVQLTFSPDPAMAGQTVTLTATVSVQLPGGGIPVGAVSFYDGTQLLGTAQLSNGTASLTTTQLPIGNDAIKATYLGNTDYLTSTHTTVAPVNCKVVVLQPLKLTVSPTQTVRLRLQLLNFYGQRIDNADVTLLVNGQPAQPAPIIEQGNTFQTQFGVYWYQLPLRLQGVTGATATLTIQVNGSTQDTVPLTLQRVP